MLYHTIKHHTTIPYHIIPVSTIPYNNILLTVHGSMWYIPKQTSMNYDIVQDETISYQTLPYHIIPYHRIVTIPYHTVSHHTIHLGIPNHTIPDHTMSFQTIQYHTFTVPQIPNHLQLEATGTITIPWVCITPSISRHGAQVWGSKLIIWGQHGIRAPRPSHYRGPFLHISTSVMGFY